MQEVSVNNGQLCLHTPPRMAHTKRLNKYKILGTTVNKHKQARYFLCNCLLCIWIFRSRCSWYLNVLSHVYCYWNFASLLFKFIWPAFTEGKTYTISCQKKLPPLAFHNDCTMNGQDCVPVLYIVVEVDGVSPDITQLAWEAEVYLNHWNIIKWKC